jgi:hypothetical protein
MIKNFLLEEGHQMSKLFSNKNFAVIMAVMFAVLMLLSACGGNTNTPSGNGSSTQSPTGGSDTNTPDNTEAGSNSEPADPTSENVKTEADGLSMRDAALAYIEMLEKMGGFSTIAACLYDICGNDIPELFVVGHKGDRYTSVLNVYTFDGKEAVNILERGLLGKIDDFSRSDEAPTDYEIMAMNDGSLYVKLAASKVPDWDYTIYYYHQYNEENGKFSRHSVASSATIKYMKGFSIFDGYAPELWDDLEQFAEDIKELRENVKSYICVDISLVSSPNPILMEDNPDMYPRTFWSKEGIVEHLKSISEGGDYK